MRGRAIMKTFDNTEMKYENQLVHKIHQLDICIYKSYSRAAQLELRTIPFITKEPGTFSSG